MTNDEMRQHGAYAQDGQDGKKSASAKDNTSDSNPPSYDFATGSSGPSDTSKPTLIPPNPILPPPGASTHYPQQQMHYYENPMTGHVLASPLPPDHPEMQCLQAGGHVAGATRWGILGVLAAVFWFPLGIGLCLLDRRVVCRRCGVILDGGLSC